MISLIKNNLFFLWVKWQVMEAPLFLLQTWKGIFLFNFRFFSISFLLKTLFSYWHRYRWYYKPGFMISANIEVFFSNLISRFLGSVMRMILIITSVLIGILIFIFGSIILITWFLLPLITGLIFIIAFSLLF